MDPEKCQLINVNSSFFKVKFFGAYYTVLFLVWLITNFLKFIFKAAKLELIRQIDKRGFGKMVGWSFMCHMKLELKCNCIVTTLMLQCVHFMQDCTTASEISRDSVINEMVQEQS